MDEFDGLPRSSLLSQAVSFFVIWRPVVAGALLAAHCHAASLLTSSTPVSAPQTYAKQHHQAHYRTQKELKQSTSV